MPQRFPLRPRPAPAALAAFLPAAFLLAAAPAAWAQKCPTALPPERMVILDASGSMENWATPLRATRIEAAKIFIAAMTREMAARDDPGRTGLVVFGAQEPANTPPEPPTCADIRVALPFADRAAGLTQLDDIARATRPKGGPLPGSGGRSPLFQAITLAAAQFPPRRPGLLVVVTDLESDESCSPPQLAGLGTRPPAEQQTLICAALDDAIRRAERDPRQIRLQFVIGAGIGTNSVSLAGLIAACHGATVATIDAMTAETEGAGVGDRLVDCLSAAPSRSDPPPAEADGRVVLRLPRVGGSGPPATSFDYVGPSGTGALRLDTPKVLPEGSYRLRVGVAIAPTGEIPFVVEHRKTTTITLTASDANR